MKNNVQVIKSEVLRKEFYNEIMNFVNESKKQIVSYVNTTILYTYWNIGKMIIEEQNGNEKAKYGNKLISELSKQMTKDFGKGYDGRNLRHMRRFYICFPIWTTVRLELSWTHYRMIIAIDEQPVREYYINESIKSNWSSRQLERQIATCAYSRVISNKLLDISNVKEIEIYHPNTVIKDPYMLEFLGLDSNAKILEKDLEHALIDHLQKFLLELGRGFYFVERQKRISFNNEHYFIDLVFYNVILRCYVVIDLKTDKLSHESLGQIDLYRNYYDQEIKMKEDNPTIGLLLVTEQDTLVAKYSSIYKNDKIFVSKYMTCMPTEEELRRIINEEKQLIEEYKKRG